LLVGDRLIGYRAEALVDGRLRGGNADDSRHGDGSWVRHV